MAIYNSKGRRWETSPVHTWEEVCLPGHRFFNLPFVMHRIKKLQLTNIYELDDRIVQLTNLEELDLSDNKLSHIPEFINQLTHLIELNLSSNKLTKIPRCIENLKKLKKIDLSKNNISYVDEFLYELDESAIVYLDGCKFSEQCVAQIMRTCNAPEYKGPVIYMSVDDSQRSANPDSVNVMNSAWNQYIQQLESEAPFQDEDDSLRTLAEAGALSCVSLHPRSLEQAPQTYRHVQEYADDDTTQILRANASNVYETRLQEYELDQARLALERELEEQQRVRLLNEADTIMSAFNNLLNIDKNRIERWVSRVKDISDYARNKKLFAVISRHIADCLRDADNHPDLRETLYMIIDEADRTCGDRVALSLVYLDLQHSLHKCRRNLHSWKSVFNLLMNGSWTISTLESFARYKMTTLKFVDEIEVYLGYLVKLKTELDIPINIDSMMYFGISCIDPKDLEIAKSFVMKNRYLESVYCDFLIEQDIWIEILRYWFGEELTNIEKARQKHLEDCLTNDTASLGQSIYKQELKLLTIKLINRDPNACTT
jgi:Leucine-rich repeat (LRR) protein